MLQQLLKSEIFKILGKGGEPYMGELTIMVGLDNPIETLNIYISSYFLDGRLVMKFSQTKDENLTVC